jgi:hypothetical protein
MLCITRYTNETHAQHFADGRHKFYLEFRCNNLCKDGMDCCEKCSKITNGPVVQYFRTFNHGKVNEPIPDRSHIYGGKWYYQVIKKYGAPPAEIIEFAIQYQKLARAGFIVHDYNPDELDKTKKESISQEMPPAKPDKILESMPVKRTRKPNDAAKNTLSESTTTTIQQPVKRTRKPRATAETITESSPKKTTSSRKKLASTASTITTASTTSTVTTTPITTITPITKEVVIPTHLENKLDKIDVDGFQIEYIKLHIIEVNGSTYLIDRNKNKLYKKIKERPGPYVGRWNPDTDTIITDIPDSDDEN